MSATRAGMLIYYEIIIVFFPDKSLRNLPSKHLPVESTKKMNKACSKKSWLAGRHEYPSYNVFTAVYVLLMMKILFSLFSNQKCKNITH